MALYASRFQCKNGEAHIQAYFPTELTEEECEEAGYTKTCDDADEATYWLYTCVDTIVNAPDNVVALTGTFESIDQLYSEAECLDGTQLDQDYVNITNMTQGECVAAERPDFSFDVKGWCDEANSRGWYEVYLSADGSCSADTLLVVGNYKQGENCYTQYGDPDDPVNAGNTYYVNLDCWLSSTRFICSFSFIFVIISILLLQ